MCFNYKSIKIEYGSLVKLMRKKIIKLVFNSNKIYIMCLNQYCEENYAIYILHTFQQNNILEIRNK